MGAGVVNLPRVRGRRGRASALALLLASSLGGCGFAEVFCGNSTGTCEAELVDVRTVASRSGEADALRR